MPAGRKDATQIFSNLLRKHSGADDTSAGSSGSGSGGGDTPSAAVWLAERPALLLLLLRGGERPEIALSCGAMLRDAIRHERLASVLLEERTTIPTLCRCIESAHFDVASDAYASLRDLLTRHRAIVAKFLSSAYAPFFEQYMRLVRSPNYVTRRQSLKLLGELLLDRSNFPIMTRCSSSPQARIERSQLA